MKLYLAAPYTHKDKKIVLKRVKAINKAAAKLISLNFIVYSPISHCHAIAIENKLPTDANFWRIQNEEFISWCDIMVILTLKGWEKSTGLLSELALAHKCRKQTFSYDRFLIHHKRFIIQSAFSN